eukprot:Pgem_evm1s1190
MIVFDKDGTLGNDKKSLIKWYTQMTCKIVSKLKSNNLKLNEQEKILSECNRALGWDSQKEELAPSAPIAAATWIESMNLLANWHQEIGIVHGEDEPLIDHLPQLMNHCKTNYNLITAICTSDVTPSTMAALKNWNIDSKMDFVCCADMVEKPKPSSIPLLMLCQQAGVKPGECIVVGDTLSDTGMAKAAKAGLMVGVLSGTGTRKQLTNDGAHVLLDNVSGIPSLLECIMNNCNDIDGHDKLKLENITYNTISNINHSNGM